MAELRTPPTPIENGIVTEQSRSLL